MQSNMIFPDRLLEVLATLGAAALIAYAFPVEREEDSSRPGSLQPPRESSAAAGPRALAQLAQLEVHFNDFP